ESHQEVCFGLMFGTSTLDLASEAIRFGNGTFSFASVLEQTPLRRCAARFAYYPSQHSLAGCDKILASDKLPQLDIPEAAAHYAASSCLFPYSLPYYSKICPNPSPRIRRPSYRKQITLVQSLV